MPQKFDWFIYCTNVVSLAAAVGASGAATLQIAADAHFQVQQITVTILQASLAVSNWGGTVTIEWQAEGRTLSNIAFPVNALQLNGTEPYILQPYRLIPSNSNIIVTWTNNIATATDCYMSFHGNKIRGRADA